MTRKRLILPPSIRKVREGSWKAAFSLFLEGPQSTSTGVHFQAWEGLEDKQGTANKDLLRADGTQPV